jgi:hypothetical protein
MEQLKLSKETAIKMYKETSDLNIKKILEESFGKDIFNIKITDRIKTIGDVINILGENDDDVIDYRKAIKYNFRLYTIANIALTMISKVLNEGWEADWTDGNQKKWYPYFKEDASTSRFVFSDSAYADWFARTGGGSRLCFREESLAAFAANRFPDFYNHLLSKK